MAASSSITWASEVPGTRREVRGSVTFDSSYPTGGEAVTLAQLGLTRLDWLSVETTDGYVPAWDGSTSSPKIKLFWVDTTTDGAALAQVPSTTDVSAVVVRFHATGA
jgi:hypothetical protein